MRKKLYRDEDNETSGDEGSPSECQPFIMIGRVGFTFPHPLLPINN
ncbi:MAG: hypothetical protein MjAS7_1959 [Metallosphaera javensis (ex Sakai et al. 2022)]|nr:MAG: hypothetical protein MjAS7_1959 [Metallosphaera javensis (ex Sakai et al. 2022)]